MDGNLLAFHKGELLIPHVLPIGLQIYAFETTMPKKMMILMIIYIHLFTSV